MKKMLAVMTAVATTGCIASTAVAEVTLKGDARARVIYKDNYDFGNSEQEALSFGDSRVRINFEGKTAGGAYAKARVRLIDTKFNGAADSSQSNNIWSDIAYIGVPIGSTVIEAGKRKSNLTKFFQWDQGVSRLNVDWQQKDWSVSAFIDIESEGQLSDVAVDRLQDNDWIKYGLVVKGTCSAGWTGQVNLVYADDQRDENSSGVFLPAKSGFLGSAYIKGAAVGMDIEAEVAYEAADLLDTSEESVDGYLMYPEDDGWGWFGNVGYPLGAFTPSLNIGGAFNGYKVDNDFGWIMTGNGNNEPIAVFDNIGGGADWFWIAPTIKYAASERLSLVGNFVWVNIDGNDNVAVSDERLAKLYELSGSLNYVISEGAEFYWAIGYLQPDFDGRLDGVGVQDDAAFGTYGRLQIKF